MSLESKVVVKHSAAVHISNNINLLQRKIWNILLANAFNDLLTDRTHSLSTDKLLKTLEYKSRNLSHIKDCLESLVSTNLKWNVFHKDGKNEWGVTSLLSGVSIIDGVIKYSYSYELSEKLHNPLMYTKLDLIIQNKFISKHSLCLYELCLDYLDFKRNSGETHWITIDELRIFLGLLENEYQGFANLNYFILKKSILEINSKTDLVVELKTKRKGKTVCELKFIINKKCNNNSFIDVEFKEIENNTEINFNNEIYNILINEYGLQSSIAIKLINDYGEEQILKNIDYVKNYKKPVSSYTGLIIDSIKHNWQISSSNHSLNNPTEIQSVNSNESNSYDIIKTEIISKRKNFVMNIYSNLDEQLKKDLKNEYINKLEAGAFGPFLMKSYKSKGFNGPGVKLQFYSVFLQNKYIELSLDEEIATYIQNINNH